MHEIAVEHEHAAGLACGRDDAALLHEPRHCLFVERPQRIGRRPAIVLGLQITGVLTARNQHERPVDRHHLVEEHGDVHCARLGHTIVALPRAIVLMPLPDITGEGGFGVDLVLMHVELFAEHLLDGLDHAGMCAEETERFIVGVCGKGRARRAALLAPDFRPLFSVDALGFLAQKIDFLGREELRQQQPAFGVKLIELFVGESHRFLLIDCWACCCSWQRLMLRRGSSSIAPLSLGLQ